MDLIFPIWYFHLAPGTQVTGLELSLDSLSVFMDQLCRYVVCAADLPMWEVGGDLISCLEDLGTAEYIKVLYCHQVNCSTTIFSPQALKSVLPAGETNQPCVRGGKAMMTWKSPSLCHPPAKEKHKVLSTFLSRI